MPYHYGFCPNKRAWDAEMVRLKLRDAPVYPAQFDGRCTFFENAGDRNACAIVTISDEPRHPVTKIGMLVHEAMHVWRAMREAIGEDVPSMEFEAYSMQSIAMGLIDAFEKSRAPLIANRLVR